MQSQLGSFDESLSTRIAHVFFLSGVDLLMTYARSLLSECLVAEFTLERLFSCVDQTVRSQASGLHKCLPTDDALIVLLVRHGRAHMFGVPDRRSVEAAKRSGARRAVPSNRPVHAAVPS